MLLIGEPEKAPSAEITIGSLPSSKERPSSEAQSANAPPWTFMIFAGNETQVSAGHPWNRFAHISVAPSVMVNFLSEAIPAKGERESVRVTLRPRLIVEMGQLANPSAPVLISNFPSSIVSVVSAEQESKIVPSRTVISALTVSFLRDESPLKGLASAG